MSEYKLVHSVSVMRVTLHAGWWCSLEIPSSHTFFGFRKSATTISCNQNG